MKIQIASDLHIRNSNQVLTDFLSITDADVLVLAGDIAPLQYAIRFLEPISDFYKDIIFVAGNHESYGNDKYVASRIKDKLINISNIHILDNESLVLNGTKFFGGTMWADIDPVCAHDIRRCINDFNCIEDFTTHDSIIMYNHFCSALQMQDTVDVIVTHFSPSTRSIHERFRMSALNSYFSSSYLDKNKVDAELWIHGHTHSNFDYKVNGTRVVCNPYGYAKENTNDYIKDLTIEV